MFKFVFTALAATLLCLGVATSYAEQSQLFNQEGYRSTQYRSPTPMFSNYAKTIEPSELLALQKKDPQLLLVDVYRNPWLRGQFTLQEQHSNLPKSLWLANCGDGSLSDEWMAYCQQNLKQATSDNKAYPIVFYCRSDCWLGWNAAKRAHALGYNNLYWLRDGTDGWEQADLPLEPAQPVPF